VPAASKSRPARESLPYRTAFALGLDLRTAEVRVREQLRAWLRMKEYDLDRFDAGAAVVGQGAVVLYAATNASVGWQLRERRDSGITWVSTIGVLSIDGRAPHCWVTLNVEPIAPPGGTLPTAASPRLIRLLLDAMDAYDGECALRAHPELVTAD